MTEEEAKTKWCPFARQMVSVENYGNPFYGFSANRFEKNHVSMCIASDCMAWRMPSLNGSTNGHCGLAGQQ